MSSRRVAPFLLSVMSDMAEQLLKTTRTTPTMLQFARAALVTIEGATKAATAVLWGQFCGETGQGVYCWNWNLGNVKHVHGDGFDYVSLKGVWEGVTAAQAQTLIATGNWVADPNPDHAKAVGPGKVSVVATSSNPASWFRAYPSLEDGMRAHAAFLQSGHWHAAWDAVVDGDPGRFAHELKIAGYYTASELTYTTQLNAYFHAFMQSSVWEAAVAQLNAEAAAKVEDFPIIHPPIYEENWTRPLDDDADPGTGEGNV
jgi:hypothetical protein